MLEPDDKKVSNEWKDMKNMVAQKLKTQKSDGKAFFCVFQLP